MYDQNLPISQLNPLPGALTSHDLIALSQERPEGWQTFNVEVSKFVDLVIAGMNDGSVFLKKVNTLDGGGLTGSGTVADALGIDFDYLNTIYASSAQVGNAVPKTTRIVAGAGLGGGGDLTTDRTISLGTPSSLGANTTNSANGQTHTHEIDKASTTVAGLVKLNDTTNSQSTSEAATARVVYSLFTTKAEQATIMYAGVGLTGGGSLAASRTISLGVPSSITANSNNTASGETHSHFIDKATTGVAGIVKLSDQLNSSSVTEAATANVAKYLQDNKAEKNVNIAVTYGLTGGGNLGESRSIGIDWSVLDSRYASASSGGAYVPQTRVVSAGNGLTGGGALNNNITLTVNFGQAANTVAMGNDNRINNGQTAWGWGDHSLYAYLKSVTRGDTSLTGSGNPSDPLKVNISHLENYFLSKNGGTVAGDLSIQGNVYANNLSTGNGIGDGQTWQNVTSSRARDTTYTNSSSRPRMISITCNGNDGRRNPTLSVNGGAMGGWYPGYGTRGGVQLLTVVPAGHTYRLDSGESIVSWWELY